MYLQIKHWDVEDEDDEIKDQDDILNSPEYVCKKRQMADALHRMVITELLLVYKIVLNLHFTIQFLLIILFTELNSFK